MQMQTIITNDAGIHCKVSCNDQFRRFLFVGTEFCSLFARVQQVLSLNKEFVLKYKDNEGDLITISSNEELTCALRYSAGSILRLTAVPEVKTTVVTESSTTEFPPSHFYGRRGGKCHGRGGRNGRFADNANATRFGPEAYKSKLTFKRDMLQSLLTELAQDGELTPDQQYRQSILQVKLRKIECRLAKFEEGSTCLEKRTRKWEAKAEKHENKHNQSEEFGHHCHGRHHEKQEKGKQQLSEETKAQIATLKTQIVTLKPGYKEVKYQMKAKKAVMKEAKAVGGNTEQLSNEIAQLKEVHKAQKNQIRPLKEQIHALKHAC